MSKKNKGTDPKRELDVTFGVWQINIRPKLDNAKHFNEKEKAFWTSYEWMLKDVYYCLKNAPDASMDEVKTFTKACESFITELNWSLKRVRHRAEQKLA